jgi:arsenate reductase
MTLHKIVFVCIHNSARSQMAEAFLNQLGGDSLIAESAGLIPGKLNPNVVSVMKEIGIDISNKSTQSVDDLLQQHKSYDAVITVCDAASAEACPVFPGQSKHLGWSFTDPSLFTGTHAEILEQIRKVRDEIRIAVTAFIANAKNAQYWLS